MESVLDAKYQHLGETTVQLPKDGTLGSWRIIEPVTNFTLFLRLKAEWYNMCFTGIIQDVEFNISNFEYLKVGKRIPQSV